MFFYQIPQNFFHTFQTFLLFWMSLELDSEVALMFELFGSPLFSQ